jgi:hypothetical protein
MASTREMQHEDALQVKAIGGMLKTLLGRVGNSAHFTLCLSAAVCLFVYLFITRARRDASYRPRQGGRIPGSFRSKEVKYP